MLGCLVIITWYMGTYYIYNHIYKFAAHTLVIEKVCYMHWHIITLVGCQVLDNRNTFALTHTHKHTHTHTHTHTGPQHYDDAPYNMLDHRLQ